MDLAAAAQKTSIAVAIAIAAALLTADVFGQAPASLKGRTNEELLQAVIGGNNAAKLAELAEVVAQVPANFWDLSPKEAALKLIEQNCDLNQRKYLQFSIDAPEGTQPPVNGEVGLRWFCSHCVAAQDGMTVLRYRVTGSSIEFSRIATIGPVKPSVVRKSVDRTNELILPQSLAERAYQTIWWLGRVKITERTPEQTDDPGTATAERMISTGDGDGKFWVLS